MRRTAITFTAVVALATATLVVTGGVASADSTTILPQSMVTERGSASGTVESLQVYDQSGGTVDPDLGVHLGPNVYKGYRTYELPAGLDPNDVWGMTVEANYHGPTRTTQRWTWYLRDFSTNKWVKLGDNTEVPADEWHLLRFYPAGPFDRYVNGSDELRVRVTSNNKPYSADLDAEWIELSYGDLPVNPGWKPPVGIRWQYELQPPVELDVTAVPWVGGAPVAPEVFDIDLFEADGVTPAGATVSAVHAQGAYAVCYVSAGSWEDWRPDAAAFPAEVKGKSNGWPGEKWLDIRRLDILLPIIEARVDKCVDAGFDAVEFDNVDGYSNSTGFKLTAAQQIEYNRALADLAHAAGLSVGLKNDVEQLTQLHPWFDFAVNEQCHQYSECGGYDAWTAGGKAVVQVEYSASPGAFCPGAIAGGRSAVKKALDLEATPWTPCD